MTSNYAKLDSKRFLAKLRGTSLYGCGVKRILDKLSSRGQDRSLLKYTNCGVCISLKIKICPLKENLGFHKYHGQTFLYQIKFGTKTQLPYRHNWRVLSISHRLSVKAEQTNLYSPPITLLESFVRSVKCPSIQHCTNPTLPRNFIFSNIRS
jgi:hypothetical protein